MAENVLDNIDLVKLGERLQQARKRRRLTQEDAAKVIAVARTTIVAIEKGERRIREIELVKLARTYGCPLTDFVRPKPEIEPFHAQFRGPSSRTAEDDSLIAPCIDELEELCRDYVGLEQSMQTPLPRRYPSEYPVNLDRLDQSAESIAIDERNRLGLGDGPIALLRDVLESEVGLRVFYMKMPSRFSAIYIYTEVLGGCIAINRDHPEERCRWSMGHDYLHFLTTRYRPFLLSEGQDDKKSDAEQLADAFSLFFLMPTAGLTRKYNDLLRAKSKPTVGDLCNLAHYYGVSLDALTRRLEDMRLIRAGINSALKADGFKVREAQKSLGLPSLPARNNMLPLRFQYLALDAFKQDLIGEEELARLLRLNRTDARSITLTLSQSVGLPSIDGMLAKSLFEG